MIFWLLEVILVEIKDYLKVNFQAKDLGKLRYFLDIEIVMNEQGLVISQHKYTQYLLSKTSMLDSKPVDSSID